MTATAVLTGLAGMASPASASSHREAPMISQDPTVDNTDVYLFRDAADPSKVNIVANYIPLQDPASGPNFFRFGDDALYEIHVDNDGDVVQDITYQFRFRTTIVNPNTFLYNTGQITAPHDGNQNIRQSYSIRKITHQGSTLLADDVISPPVNVGFRSTPDYEAKIAEPSIHPMAGGGQVFAGQREEPFFVDVGSAFDLLGLRPLNPAHLIPSDAAPGVDGLAGKNVNSIVMQLPIAEVLAPGASAACHTAGSTQNDKSCVFGVYASSSRQRVRTLAQDGGAPRASGRWTQVSRLAIPLVNEVLIPLGQKDRFNSSHPKDDAQYFGPILDPEPTKLFPVLYPAAFAGNGAPNGGVPAGGFNADGSIRRGDIAAVLSGAGAGLMGDQLLPPADLVRLNVTTPATAPNQGNRLAILAGDGGGFPNGRRLVDDVVDIELRLLAGGTPFTPEYNVAPNNILTDGVDGNDRPFKNSFPYLATPNSGYNQNASDPKPL